MQTGKVLMEDHETPSFACDDGDLTIYSLEEQEKEIEELVSRRMPGEDKITFVSQRPKSCQSLIINFRQHRRKLGSLISSMKS